MSAQSQAIQHSSIRQEGVHEPPLLNKEEWGANSLKGKESPVFFEVKQAPVDDPTGHEVCEGRRWYRSGKN